MRFRTTLVLAAALALLSLTYYFLELEEAHKEAEAHLVPFEEKAVTAFSIHRGESLISLTKGKEGWRISQPVEDRADEKEVAALLGNVTRAEITRTLEAAGDRVADFGLQDPAVILTFHLTGTDHPVVLEVGGATPAGFSVYARRKGETKVLLVPLTVKTALEKKLFAFRSKAPLVFDRGAVIAASLQTHALRLHLARREQTDWTITEPIEGKADSDKVSALLRSLAQDQVQGFLDEPPTDPKRLGLDPPRGEIRLVFDGGGETTLYLGAETQGGGVYARRQGETPVLELKAEFLKSLPGDVTELRDRTLVVLDHDAIRQIELTTPGGHTSLRKVEGRWKLKDPEDASADQRVVEDLLWDLAKARVKDFVTDDAKTLKPFGLDDPAVRIRLLDQEAKPLVILALTRAQKREGVYARVDDSRAVSLVEGRLYDRLAKAPFDFRLRQVLSFETWDVGKIELSRNGREIVVEKRKDGFELKKPKRGKAKYAAVIDLLNELRDLKWQKLVAKETTDLSRYGLDKPTATVTLTKTDATPIGTLLLGKTDGDALYAKTRDRSAVYAVPAHFMKSLPEDPSPLLE